MTTLYLKLAANGIKRNSRTYIPYLLTCSCMIMMMYIVSFLSQSSMMDSMKGGRTMRELLVLGLWVLIVFSAIFLFYTNSFLIKSRKRELGLYNILGMGKLNIARIMIWETLIMYAASMLLGIGSGILFSKLAELAAVNLMNGTADFSFEVSFFSIAMTALCFAVIFFVILLNSLRQVHFSKPVELLHSESTGERPPKANWAAALIGAILLSAAYFMAVTIEEPMSAILAFLVAVIMVIIATYLLFISGSVVLCRLLRKNKSYYYKTNHFISVSQMAYRMKRNGAGLASICILSTMVLVTLSSTICLYSGGDDMIQRRYPRDIVMTIGTDTEELGDVSGQLSEMTDTELKKLGLSAENRLQYHALRMSGQLVGNRIDLDFNNYSVSSHLCTAVIIPIEDYNKLTGNSTQLSDGEAVVLEKYGGDKLTGRISVDGFMELDVVGRCSDFPVSGNDTANVADSYYIFVRDMDTIDRLYEYQKDKYEYYSLVSCTYGFDLSCSDEEKTEAGDILRKNVMYPLRDSLNANDGGVSFSFSSRAGDKDDFFSLYGSLLFLGVLLGGVFTLAAVLIMYYKQISEGFEDRRRFDILRQVGMSGGEIRSAINSQVLTVFFLPLIAAGIHMAFAFPIVERMLRLFGLMNVSLLAVTSLTCYLAFAAVYIIVYLITSRSYYSIVNPERRQV